MAFIFNTGFLLCGDVSIWDDSFSLSYVVGGASARSLGVMVARAWTVCVEMDREMD